jgi:hypothetical protein
MLDQFEHVNEPKSLDESVSKEQHGAMEAAAHGHSNLGIPKEVGKEFSDADKGKSFDKMIRDWAMGKDWSSGMTEDDFENLKKMHEGSKDEMPENALDEEEENVNIEVEEGEDEGGKIEEEEAEDEIEEEEGEDRKPAKDSKHAKDSAMKAKPKPITQDEVNKVVQAAVATERKNSQRMMEAREMVRPWVGDLPMALDSAEKVYRAAATALEIEGAETIHPSALPTLIKMQPKPGTQSQMAHDSRDIAVDSKTAKSFHERFPGSERIGVA